MSILTGVPWWFIAAIHWREAACDFSGILHNGEKIIGTGKKTRLVPQGRGPFSTWEHAAVDALKYQKLTDNKDWTMGRVLQLLELYNGTGYLKYHPEQMSPYLWSYSNLVSPRGRYTSDGKYDPNALAETYAGAAVILKMLLEMKKPAV